MSAEYTPEVRQRAVFGEYSDTGTAIRINDWALNNGIHIRYCAQAAKGCEWVIFIGGHWQQDDTGSIMLGIVRRFVDAEMLEVARMIGAGLEDRAGVKSKAAFKLLNVKSQIPVLTMLSKLEGVGVKMTAFDANPSTVQVESVSGEFLVIDLPSSNARKAVAEDMCLKICGAKYDPEAVCPNFEDVIDKAMVGDVERVQYMKRTAGYALYGHNRDEILPVYVGSGGNLKTTVLEMYLGVMGDYAVTALPSLLMAREAGAATNDVARLVGVRLVVCSESKENDRLDDGMVKRMASNEQQTARFLHKEFIQFTPQWLVVLATNHTPIVRATDSGFWRRIILNEFNYTVPASDRDVNFRANHLDAEASGILNWMLTGARMYASEGLKAPKSVVNATGGYRSQSDVIEQWYNVSVTSGPGALMISDAWKMFVEWYKADFGDEPKTMNSRVLSKWLRGRGLTVSQTNGVTRIWGIRAKTQADWDLEADDVIA